MTPTAASRLRSLLSRLPTNHRLLSLRSLSSSAPLNPDSSISSPPKRAPNIFDDHTGGSAAYNHAVRYSRPHTIKLSDHLFHLRNSATFIGTVERSPTPYNRRGADHLGVYTVLSLKTSSVSHTSFRILVEMWDEMAKVALKHVKPGDYVYVAGRLDSYRKADSRGDDRLQYKVIVKELNYVKQHNDNQRFHEAHKFRALQSESSSKRHEDRLHLWQVFFSNAQEWHDWRRNKRNPRSPDFKHKSTGEALWLNADDPPWIKKQLEIHDSMVAAGCFDDPSSRRHVSSYVSDHL